MVKADAYNHGLERVAGYTESYVDRFGVATAEEGARLRAAGISKPVSVFTYTPRDARLTEEYSLTPVIYDLDTLASLGAAFLPRKNAKNSVNCSIRREYARVRYARISVLRRVFPRRARVSKK